MDVLLVSLGSTVGLRRAEDALAGSLERAGASVAVVRAGPQREVRTFALTDLAWARAARRAAVEVLRAGDEPRAILYYTTTAALLWPRPGAIRFDALAADNRPGRHGVWQRPLERRRLRQAPLVVPSSADVRFPTGVVVPPAVDPSGPVVARDIAAMAYGANPSKKGLDRVLRAWAVARSGSEELVVAGIEGEDADGVRYAGVLARDDYRALLRRARVFVSAPRWEDFGIAPLEALADGCVLVAMPAPGPYVALPLARALDARLVVRDEPALARAIRTGLDDAAPDYAARAARLVAPYSTAAVDALVADRLLPALLA
jgi:glycosyltransferase involved in cell wall biosynthesis